VALLSVIVTDPLPDAKQNQALQSIKPEKKPDRTRFTQYDSDANRIGDPPDGISPRMFPLLRGLTPPGSPKSAETPF
jgi:hypothetical protein